MNRRGRMRRIPVAVSWSWSEPARCPSVGTVISGRVSGRDGLWLSVTVIEARDGRFSLGLVFTPGGDLNARVRRFGSIEAVDTPPVAGNVSPEGLTGEPAGRLVLRLPNVPGAAVQVMDSVRLHNPQEIDTAWLTLGEPLSCGVDLGDLPDGTYQVRFEPVKAVFAVPPGPDEWSPWSAGSEARGTRPREKRKRLRSGGGPRFSQDQLDTVVRELVSLGPRWLSAQHCRCQAIQISTVGGRFPAPGRVVLGVDRLTPAVRAAVSQRFGDAVYLYVDGSVGVQE